MTPLAQFSMPENPEADRPYTNYSLRTFLLAMRDVIGEKGVAAMLNAARLEKFIGRLPPNNLESGVNFGDYTRLNLVVEEFYGRGARGILRRIGRATFQYGLKENKAAFMAAKGLLVFKKPFEKLRFILDQLAKGFTEQANEPTTVRREGDALVLAIEACAACWQRHDPQCVCHVNVGFLEEACAWAVDSPVKVEETLCRGRGDPVCEYHIVLHKS